MIAKTELNLAVCLKPARDTRKMLGNYFRTDVVSWHDVKCWPTVNIRTLVRILKIGGCSYIENRLRIERDEYRTSFATHPRRCSAQTFGLEHRRGLLRLAPALL